MADLTALEQYGVIFSTVIILAIVGGITWKIFNSLLTQYVAWQSEETKKQRDWQEAQAAKRDAEQLSRDNMWRAFFELGEKKENEALSIILEQIARNGIRLESLAKDMTAHDAWTKQALRETTKPIRKKGEVP